jgi:hypothetical protein
MAMSDRHPEGVCATDLETARLRRLLAEAADALVDVGKKAIVVKPTLAQPWSRFMEAPAKRAYNLGIELRREFGGAR